ncbi:SWIM zinc finger family protein [Anaerolineales bacterium HSG6]|nr:SWIM zinc finger family protein [Anaerolineales bacterium HSG6]
MYSIPQLHQFGNLELIEVYEFYDKPLLYSCKNASSIFLVILVDEDDDDSDTWLYQPVSYNRFKQVRSGVIDLRETFSSSETNTVFEVRILYGDEQYEHVKQIPANAIPEKWLPLPGEHLDNQETVPLNDTLSTSSLPKHEVRTSISLDAGIISKIEKAILYAREPERIRFSSFTLTFEGYHKQHQVMYNDSKWQCNCSYFQNHSVCSHIIALERVLKGFVQLADKLSYMDLGIISEIERAMLYTNETDLLTFNSFNFTFDGDHKQHDISYNKSKWQCSCSYFYTHGVCSHVMAIERILVGTVSPTRDIPVVA